MLVKVDNQPINARHGDSYWLTDFVMPANPDIRLKWQELSQGVSSPVQAVTRLWQYVANLPYRETVPSRTTAGSLNNQQSDTWFFPPETMRVRVSNCANKSFLLASLLKNLYPSAGYVYVVLGRYAGEGIGGHAWVQAKVGGKDYFIETTQPRLPAALIAPEKASNYQAQLFFDEHGVYLGNKFLSARDILNQRFGLCAQPFLEKYLCQHCLALKGV